MSDLISRQAAIDALDVLCQEHRYKIPGKRETYSQYNEAWQDALDRAEGAIGNLPSAQPERQWIPCSEIPYPDNPRRVQVQLDNGWIITAWWDGAYWFSVPESVPEWDRTYVPIDCKVEAWCELPKPYRGE